MTDLDWEDVRHFTALARTLNLARAAAELGTSQVTVMRRVRALEKALGATLFLRCRDGHRLTGAGAEFHAATGEAGELIRDAAAHVAARDGADRGRVRIVTTELAANWILLPALPAFLAAHRDLRIEIDASPAASSLVDDAETLAVRFRRPDRGPLRIRKLAELPFALYRSPQTPPGAWIDWAGPFAEITLARWLRRAHAGTEPAVAVTTFDGHIRAARGGLGVTALPTFVGDADAALQRVETRELFALQAWLVVPIQIAATARVQQVSRFLAKTFAGL